MINTTKYYKVEFWTLELPHETYEPKEEIESGINKSHAIRKVKQKYRHGKDFKAERYYKQK